VTIKAVDEQELHPADGDVGAQFSHEKGNVGNRQRSQPCEGAVLAFPNDGSSQWEHDEKDAEHGPCRNVLLDRGRQFLQTALLCCDIHQPPTSPARIHLKFGDGRRVQRYPAGKCTQRLLELDRQRFRQNLGFYFHFHSQEHLFQGIQEGGSKGSLNQGIEINRYVG
jgi:hypothetical protein